MKNKIVFTFFVCIVLIGLTSAVTYKQSTTLDFKQTCTRNGMVCNSSAECNLSIKYPNSVYLIEKEAMTNRNNGDFNYTFNSTQTNIVGMYTWDMYCCQLSDCGEAHGTFDVNPIGIELTVQKSIIYGWLFFIIIFLFIIIIFGINKLPDGDNRNNNGELISIGWLKYLKSVLVFVEWLLLVAIFYLSSNLAFAYMGEQLFAKTLFMMFKITFGLTLPIIVIWFIWIFVNIIQDKKLKRMIDRGIYPPQYNL